MSNKYLYKSILLGTTTLLLSLPILTTAANNYVPTLDDTPKISLDSECGGAQDKIVKYKPAIGDKTLTIDSADKYSPVNIKNDWIISDHKGTKDTAFDGERHVAYISPGVVMFGYDIPPHSDFMLHKFDYGDKTINVLQGPYRADWHTFKGNGIIFNAKISGLSKPGDYLPNQIQGTIVSGYLLGATASALELKDLSGIKLSALANDSSVLDNCNTLWSTPKECSVQDFTISYKAGIATGYLNQLKLFELPIADGNCAGLVSCYAEHNCSSLSSIYFNNFTYNGKNFLMKQEG